MTLEVGCELPDESSFQDWRTRQVYPVRGLFVGRLFVRPTLNGEASYAVETRELIAQGPGWVVDLPDIRIGLTTVRTFDTALLIADEISRYAPEIHEVESVEEVIRIMPAQLGDWVVYASSLDKRGETPPCFRAWGGG